MSVSWHPKDATDVEIDLGVIGVPCPLFSVLNQRKRLEGYNPFCETLGQDTTVSTNSKMMSFTLYTLTGPLTFVFK